MVGEGLMIGVNDDRVGGAVKEVSPFFKSADNSEEFLIVYGVILFSW